MDVSDRCTKIVYVRHSLSAIMEDGIQNLIYSVAHKNVPIFLWQ